MSTTDPSQNGFYLNPSTTILNALQHSALLDLDKLVEFKELFKEEDGRYPVQTLLFEAKELLDVFLSLNPLDPSLLKYIKRDLINSINYLLEFNESWEQLIMEYKRLERNGNLLQVDKLAQEFYSSKLPAFTSTLELDLKEFITRIGLAINLLLINKFNQSKKEVEALELKISIAAKEIEEKNERATELVNSIAMLPSKQQIEGYSHMFETDSKSYKSASKGWLVGIFVCLVLIILSGFVIYNMSLDITLDAKTGKPVVMPDSQLLIAQISRLLIITCLFYALTICNKNYKSSKHNEVVNKHRANALSSFQAFVGNPYIDFVSRNAVLLEATRTIYSVQQTGYVQTDSDDPTTKIIELVKGTQAK